MLSIRVWTARDAASAKKPPNASVARPQARMGLASANSCRTDHARSRQCDQFGTDGSTTLLFTVTSTPPAELLDAIKEFFPASEVENALAISQLESAWDAFALADTTADHPCGTVIGELEGVPILAERSVGYFQINSCNFPDWEWQRFYNARHNVGTAHLIWDQAGGSWKPWYFSAAALGLL